MAAKLAVIIALGLALTASALTQRRSGGVNEDLTSNLNSVEAEIQRKVAAAYDKGKKLGYNEGVAASRGHFEADGRKLGRREGCVRSIRQQVLPFFNICRLAFIYPPDSWHDRCFPTAILSRGGGHTFVRVPLPLPRFSLTLFGSSLYSCIITFSSYKEGLGVGEKDGLHRGFTQGEKDGKTRGYREGVRVGEAHGELEGQRLKEAQEAKMLAQLHQSLEKQ